ncbi:cell division protein ZapB [Candidatus Profftia tarda]|nr:cell division protein ZapB [Candidatus Profftia tarda]
MSFDKLEEKVQRAIDTITLLQMEIEVLKEQNNKLTEKGQQDAVYHETLIRENEELKAEKTSRQERLRSLLDRMDEV